MRAALDEADLPAEVLPALRAFFDDAATFMINRQGSGKP